MPSTVTAVRWCVLTLGAGGYRAQLRQSIGNVGVLNQALHAPLTVAAPANLACSAVGYAAFTMEVLDQHDRLFRPRLPTDACGSVGGTVDALARTAYTVLATYRIVFP